MLLALLLGLLTTVANVLGSYLAVITKHPSRRVLSAAIAFGGGYLLAAAILEMIPESVERGDYMPTFIALGFLIVYFGEHILNVHIHEIPSETQAEGEGHTHNPGAAQATVGRHATALVAAQAGIASLLAFNVHDFTDGLAIGAAMMAGQGIGILVFLAVLFHELPVGFTIAAIMRGAGRSRRFAFLSGVSIGLITLVGIAIPFLVGGVNSFTTDVFLALATGTFIYLGASILIPAAETGGYRWTFLYVALGFGVFYLSAQLVGMFLEV